MITFNNSPLQASELLSLYPNQPISQPECFARPLTYAVEEYHIWKELSMTQSSLFNTPEFQKLHPVKKQIIQELASTNQNMSPELMLTKVMAINKELSKRSLNFTKEESTLLIRIMKQNMSPSDQQKVDLLMGLLNR